MSVVQTLLTLIRLGVLGTFFLAGTSKVISPSTTRRSARDLGMPAVLARIAPIALPISELAVTLGLLYQSTSRPAAVAALLILLVFSGIVAINLARGNRVRCSCFGSLSSSRLGRGALIRNGILAGGAVVIALSPFATRASQRTRQERRLDRAHPRRPGPDSRVPAARRGDRRQKEIVTIEPDRDSRATARHPRT